MAAKPVIKEKEHRQLKHKFSEDEKKELASEMAKAVLERDEAQREMKSVQAQFTSRIKGFEMDIYNVAEKLRSGYEYRYTEIEIQKNFNTLMIIIVRLDTGEIINERKMTKTEAQLPVVPAEQS